MKAVLEGSYAIAEAVRLCKPKVIAAYPITPQTKIVEHLAKLVADGKLNAEFLNVESEHSAMAACIGAQATGVRTFTATASAGLALMHEMLGVASGMRLPIVMVVANRALSAPLNIWNDWSDSMAEKDMGWIQLYCESNQEAVDTVIQAYRIGESVNLPVMVCIDGFYLSHTYEPIEIPENVEGFIREYMPSVRLDPENPISMGEYARPDSYQEFKEQQFRAMEKAKEIIKTVNQVYGRMFGRVYGDGLIEVYNEGAKHVIITMGSVSSNVKHIINEGEKIGLIRIRAYRPFPAEDLKKLIDGVERIGVVEKDVCFGLAGSLYTDVKSIVDIPVMDFIGGLGGRDIKIDELKKIVKTIKEKTQGIFWIGSKLGGKNVV